ncbi:MAG: transcriptional regulator [Clostridia bacterium]|nr:transcriptional regulator [Clostridia bacterium]MBR2221027.1 transcriptional regulator [Clostridia bacterium]MBR2433688.1 transcriptional regulator [Clostridia bacterium]MBR3790706.1 transcriptional regulator [Clostridia bacterium]
MEQPIKKRILEIVTQQGKSITAICLNGNLTPSTLFDFIEGKSHCPKVSTIKKFCAGAGITLSEFFAPEYFNDTDDVYG